MSSALPDIVDPWRMVQARRTFEGKLPLAGLRRLASSLAATTGEVEYELDFDKDEFGVSGVRVRATAALPLVCQRTLETFALPVRIDTRLGLITDESEEAALPPGTEPLLVEPTGLRPADVIEDELILALPLVPVKPGTQEVSTAPAATDDTMTEKAAKPNPFAVLKKATFNK